MVSAPFKNMSVKMGPIFQKKVRGENDKKYLSCHPNQKKFIYGYATNPNQTGRWVGILIMAYIILFKSPK